MAVALDRADGVAGEEVGQDPLHDRPVGQHVGDAGRGPQVVLEDQELALVVPHQVDARDVAADAARRRHAVDLTQVERAREHGLGRHHALAEDQLRPVDVLQEVVERLDPLLQPGLQAPPGPGRDHPRDDVEGKDLLDPLGVRVDGEGDAVVAEHLHRQVVAASELVGAEPAQLLEHPPVGGPCLLRAGQHLVVEPVRLVAGSE